MYRPKVMPELIPEMYQITKEVKRPMTKVVDSMIRDGIRRWKQEKERSQNNEDNPIKRPASPEGSPGI